MPDINDRIRVRIDAFAEEIGDLVRRAALEAVNEALRTELRSNHSGGGNGSSAGGASARRAAPSSSASNNNSSSSDTAARRTAGRRKGQKRSQDEITSSSERVLRFIDANPGSGVEQIGKELGEITADLTLPLRKLLSEKRISKKGQKRGTRYYSKGR